MGETPLLGVDRFRVHVDKLGEIDVAYAGPLERRVDAAPSLVLRRPLGSDRTLYDWYERAVSPAGDARDVAVCQLAADGSVLNCWIARAAHPVSWRGPTFDALALAVAEEEVELAYTRLDWPGDLRRLAILRPIKPANRRVDA